MENSPLNRQDSINNGLRQQTNSRLDRSLSRPKDDNDAYINRSSTATSLSEQAKPDELASGKMITKETKEKRSLTIDLGLATMGLLNDDDMNKVTNVFFFIEN